MVAASQEWALIPTPDGLVANLHEAVGGHPLVACVLAQRGIHTPQDARAFLDPDAYTPAPPDALPDLETAAGLLQAAIKAGQRILIWGDFDVDGQTATALLLDGLRGLGAEVHFYVPHRLRESHGIRVPRLEAMIREHRPDALLTCDTGVSEHEAIAHANAHGLTVIVTDHHDLPPTLPPAAAIVNPRRLPEGHPLRSLPGVGVAYKLMQALYHEMGRAEDVDRFLDLVALGIVADVAEQTHDTRYLLQKGLGRLRNTDRLGLRALLEVAGVAPEYLSAEDIGYQLGPRLNAVGRLDDATQAVELLTTQDPIQARVIAANLDGLNKKRQVMQRQILAAAQELIATQPDLLDHEALVLSHAAWHPGLLGIVAGQLAERYQRPCVLLVAPPDEPLARGSARSVPGYDIGQAIAAQADLLHEYGGHPGAAGLSLPADHIARFRRSLSRTLSEQKTAAAILPLEVAAEVSLDEVTPELADELERLAPFGEGNPPVVLAATDLTLTRQRYLGLDRLHRRLTVCSAAGTEREVLWWNGAEHAVPDGAFDLAFTVGQRVYRGERELRLTLVALRERVPVEVVEAPRLVIEDWRSRALETGIVETFRAQEPDGAIWVEGAHGESASGQARGQLLQAEALLIYTAPPSPGVLHAALEQADACRVYLLGIAPPEQTMNAFLRRLLGLAKFAIHRKAGRTDLSALAAATAQTEAAALWGLRLLAAKGAIAFQEQEESVVIAPPADDFVSDDDKAAETTFVLQAMLAETAAYRAFFSRAAPDMLLA